MGREEDVTAVLATLARAYPTFADSDDPWMTNGLSATEYRMITSVALSTMTRSERVIRAAVALYEVADSFEALAAMQPDDLVPLIKPVAHYNRKAALLPRMARDIRDLHGGHVPADHDQLMALPGIGRKCADLTMNFLHDTPTVGVDTHVHRVVNRLGWVATTTAEATADALAVVVPDGSKPHAHEYLIQLGMQVCVARTPLCSTCPVAQWCPRVGVNRST